MRDGLIYVDTVQGTPDWMNHRSGVITASEFDKVLTPKTLKASTQVDGYIARLAAEHVMGHPIESDMTSHMAWGLMYEDEARKWYQFEKGITTERPGFIFMDDRKVIGCSPDSMGLEIKCPSPAVHTRYLLDGILPTDYICQVQGLMFVTGAEEWDFLSYHPELPPFLITVKADPVFHERLGEELEVAVEKLIAAKTKLDSYRD